jgi:hypothetical protein
MLTESSWNPPASRTGCPSAGRCSARSRRRRWSRSSRAGREAGGRRRRHGGRHPAVISVVRCRDAVPRVPHRAAADRPPRARSPARRAGRWWAPHRDWPDRPSALTPDRDRRPASGRRRPGGWSSGPADRTGRWPLPRRAPAHPARWPAPPSCDPGGASSASGDPPHRCRGNRTPDRQPSAGCDALRDRRAGGPGSRGPSPRCARARPAPARRRAPPGRPGRRPRRPRRPGWPRSGSWTGSPEGSVHCPSSVLPTRGSRVPGVPACRVEPCRHFTGAPVLGHLFDPCLLDLGAGGRFRLRSRRSDGSWGQSWAV